jgi:hypothetical protein
VSRRPAKAVSAAIAVALALLGAYLVRPVFHGFVMSFYKNPLVWLPPLLVLVVSGVVVLAGSRTDRAGRAAGRPTDPRDDPTPLRPRRPSPYSIEELRRTGPPPVLIGVAALTVLLFLVGAFLNTPLTARAVYTNTSYEEIPGLPAGGTVRLVPRDVAVQSTSSGFNSPTERLSDFHIVRTPRGLEWTSLRTPDGTVRTFTKKSQGIVSLDALQTERNSRQTDARLEVAPGLQVTDNLRWRILKEHFLVDPVEPTAILDDQGRPLIVAPYLEYRGILVRRPVLGGVFVVNPDGRIEDLSPEQARARPEIARSGRLYPEPLARIVQDAYAYKRGIVNRFFFHEEQTQITDTESNEQPYLIDFGARGAKWVTVAEPYGRAFAANAIFLTDTVTGATQIWRVPRNQSLSGNRRAIQTVRSASIPGVVFAGDDARGPSAGGRFQVVEPRPVFTGGRLVYLLSIVPESANAVSKSVIVDAASNKVVRIFDSDLDPDADRQTVAFLATGKAPADSGVPAGSDAGAPGATASSPSAGGASPAPGGGSPSGARGSPPAGTSAERRIDRLIERQRQVLRDTEALRESLRESR